MAIKGRASCFERFKISAQEPLSNALSPPPLHALLTLLCTGCPADSPPYTLPEIAASSSLHIDYATWADSSLLCMDAAFRDWEELITTTSNRLDIRFSGRIHLTWIPDTLQNSENWPCAKIYTVCTRFDLIGYQAAIFTSKTTRSPTDHEFIHAITISTMGHAHPVFQEGEAEYFGSSRSTNSISEDYPKAFKSTVDNASSPETYIFHYIL